jgi:hypothetical protein
MKNPATQPSQQRITDDQWREIKKFLPENIDATPVRIELERIARDDTTPTARAKECEERARRSRHTLELIGSGSGLAEELARQIHRDDEQAKIFRQVAKQRQPHKFLRQYEILSLWESVGGHLGVSTPRKPELRWPDPEGPVIAYFQAASKAVFGKSPSASQAKQVLRRYRHLKFAGATLSATGAMSIDVLHFDEHGNLVEDEAERIPSGGDE